MPPFTLSFILLYLIATPIGNLADITFRAIEQLKLVDYVLCEDTRTSKILLNHYQIQKPLKSFHKFNEKASLDRILQDLKQEKNIALISDAGTPGICDPGSILVAACRKENLPVTSLPGPCAAILALTLSGLSCERFQFIGFFPKTKTELQKFLAEALSYPGITIGYESPHRLLETLSLLPSSRQICVVREMSKIYEECLLGSSKELFSHFTKNPPRGEIVLLISGLKKDYTDLPVKDHVSFLQEEYNLSLQDAIKLAASLREIPKKEVYRVIHHPQIDSIK